MNINRSEYCPAQGQAEQRMQDLRLSTGDATHKEDEALTAYHYRCASCRYTFSRYTDLGKSTCCIWGGCNGTAHFEGKETFKSPISSWVSDR